MWQRGALPWRLQSAHAGQCEWPHDAPPTFQSTALSLHRFACSVHRQTQPSARLPCQENWKLEPDWKQEPSALLGTEFCSNPQGHGSSQAVSPYQPLLFLSSDNTTLSFIVSPFPITASICLNVPLTSAQKPALPMPTSEIEFLRFIPQITERV